MNDGMRIAELAKRTGTSPSALRYYESRGLLAVDARSQAGYRLYGPQSVGRVGFIQRAKALGLSLREIEGLLAEPPGPHEQQRIRHAVGHKLAETERRIGELEALRVELRELHERLGRSEPVCGHIGDCECWLPTQAEVDVMAQIAEGCSCCDCTCEPDESGCCSCCGCGRK